MAFFTAVVALKTFFLAIPYPEQGAKISSWVWSPIPITLNGGQPFALWLCIRILYKAEIWRIAFRLR